MPFGLAVRSIQSKILIIILSVLGVTLGLWGTATIKKERDFFLMQTERRVRSIAQNFALMNIEAILSRDYPIIQTNVEMVGKRDPDILKLEVFREAQSVASYQAPDADQNHPEDKIQTREPIVYQDSRLGEITILFSTQAAHAALRERMIILAGTIVFIFFLLTFFLQLIMQRIIINPIAEISRFAVAIGHGGLRGSIKPHSQDEIGTLAEAMNQMVVDLDIAQKQKVEAVRQLAAGVAHNINNLAMGASDATENLRDSIKDLKGILKDKADLLEEAAQWISKPLGHIIELVQKLMTSSRINGSDFSETNIQECLDDSIQMVQLLFKKSLKIHKNYGASNSRLFCSPQDLNGAFVNILKNAAEAIQSKADGEILVETKNNHAGLMVKIQDNGVGMDEATKAHIFEPFFTTKDVGERGTGVGLTTVYDTIEAHRGTISVESQAGKGTTFQLTLPMVESFSKQEGENKP